MKLRFIGDVHGEFVKYQSLLADCECSIQLGDFGLGFHPDRVPTYIQDQAQRHFFIRGNHDNPKVCQTYSNFIPDGSFFKDFVGVSDINLFALGGALSTDKEFRVEGISWFPDEEATIPDLYRFIDHYAQVKPRVVVSHDCPVQMLSQFKHSIASSRDPKNQSRTRQALTAMFETFQPPLWAFGHYHVNKDITVQGCRFICVDSLNYVDIEF